MYKPWGMLCYAKEYSPRSKTALQGRECRVLGYSATQKAFLLIEVSTGKKIVSPHVHFVWGEFPGLRPLSRGGQPVTYTPTSDSSQPSGLPTADATPTPPPPPDADHSDSDSGDGPGDLHGDDDTTEPNSQPLSARLGRVPRQIHRLDAGGIDPGTYPHAGHRRPAAAASHAVPDLSSLPEVSLDLHVPDGVSFVLYLCSGEAVGTGSLAGFLRDAGIYTVPIDVKLGGYAHDMTVKAVQHKVQDLAARPGCLGVISSVPCGSWSVLRYNPQANAPGVERRLPHHMRGVPRADGSFAPSVVLGNTILDFSILVSELAIAHGGFAFFESPVSRAAHSPFAIAGREDHAAMWDDPPLDEHLELNQY